MKVAELSKQLFVILAVCLVMPVAAAGSLRVGSPAFDGDQVILPVLLDGDVESGVAAIDFRLNYDPEVLRPVSTRTGEAAANASKQVQANLANPGEYVVVMMGMNQNTVAPGEVAHIVMEQVGEPQNGRSSVRISRTTFASAEGMEIPSQGSSGAIDFNQTESGDENGASNGDESESSSGSQASGSQSSGQTSQQQQGFSGAQPQSNVPSSARSISQNVAPGANGGGSGGSSASSLISGPPVRSRAAPEGEENGASAGPDQLARLMDQADGARSDIPTPDSGGRPVEPGAPPDPADVTATETGAAPSGQAQSGDRQQLAQLRGDGSGVQTNGGGADDSSGESSGGGSIVPGFGAGQNGGPPATAYVIFAAVAAVIVGLFFFRRKLVG